MITAQISIKGDNYVCVVEVIANKQMNRLYVHEVTLTKNLHGNVADTNAVHGDNNLVTHPQGEIAKVLQNYITSNKSADNNQTIGINTIIDNNGTTREAAKWTHGADNVVEESKINIKKNIKRQIRLNESQLNEIVKELVKGVLKEGWYDKNMSQIDKKTYRDSHYDVDIRHNLHKQNREDFF